MTSPLRISEQARSTSPGHSSADPGSHSEMVKVWQGVTVGGSWVRAAFCGQVYAEHAHCQSATARRAILAPRSRRVGREGLSRKGREAAWPSLRALECTPGR